MNPTPILANPWPHDLNPADVPFVQRTQTVLERQGLFDDRAMFNTLTAADIAAWWNAGSVTINDLRTTGNRAIQAHHAGTELRQRLNTAMDEVAAESWSHHIWRLDPRFTDYLPPTETPVHGIATSGRDTDRRFLWGHLDALRGAVLAQDALPLQSAVSRYVEAVSDQHGRRLEVLLERTGLSGHDPITGAEAGRRLGITSQRIHQIVQQLHHRLNRARPPAGIWMPQIGNAVHHGWPDDYTAAGIAATLAVFEHPAAV